jgi:hypothetical protein
MTDPVRVNMSLDVRTEFAALQRPSSVTRDASVVLISTVCLRRCLGTL